MAATQEKNTIGERLKKERLSQKETLEAIAKTLCIQKIYLEAFEKGTYTALPERVFAIGFLNAYASHLGLDPKPIIQEFKAHFAGESEEDTASNFKFPEPFKAPQFPIKSIIFTAVILFVIFALIWSFYLPGGKQAPLIDPIEVPLLIEIKPKKMTTNDILLEKETPAIQLFAIEDSWFKITDSKGTVIATALLKAGESYRLPVEVQGRKLFLDIGNAGGVELLLQGVNQGTFGRIGDVRRAIPLN